MEKDCFVVPPRNDGLSNEVRYGKKIASSFLLAMTGLAWIRGGGFGGFAAKSPPLFKKRHRHCEERRQE